jgi:hypothetical protein
MVFLEESEQYLTIIKDAPPIFQSAPRIVGEEKFTGG